MKFFPKAPAQKSPLLNSIFGLLSVLVLAAATWFTVTQTWIATDINHWQANVINDGKYFPVLTIGIMVIPPLLVLLLAKLLLLKLIGNRQKKKQNSSLA